MLGQLLGDECWKVHEPPAMCLRLAKDEAITQARAAADQRGTSGARRRVVEVEEKRHQRVEGGVAQANWTVANVDLLQTYSVVTDELEHGVDAWTVGYQLARPADVLEAPGPRPTSQPGASRWDRAATHHAEARIRPTRIPRGRPMSRRHQRIPHTVRSGADSGAAPHRMTQGPEGERSLCGRLIGRVEMSGCNLDVSGQHCREHLIETTRSLPRHPPFTTRRTLLHRHLEDERHLAVPFRHLGPTNRDPIFLTTTYTRHQRLSRWSEDHLSSWSSYTVTIRSSRL